ncbi:hypothetical protein [Dactylosporangium salmoneum]|uniref:DUF2569 domain-containing protein n=1 Tax=Dactylosporangium salmoneum TaxID=53361 RepID=A0ABN3FJA3_9ACTN
MFKYRTAATWLLAGLIGSVLLRGLLWLATFLTVTPLLGPVAYLSSPAIGEDAASALWIADNCVSPLLALVTFAVWRGLRSYRPWALRTARALAWCYVAANVAAATTCATQMSRLHLLAVPCAVYVATLPVACMVLRRLAAYRALLHRPAPVRVLAGAAQ